MRSKIILLGTKLGRMENTVRNESHCFEDVPLLPLCSGNKFAKCACNVELESPYLYLYTVRY